MTFRIARIDPSRRGGIIETRAKLWDFRKNKIFDFSRKKTRKLDANQILQDFLYKIAKVAMIHWPKIR